MPLDLAAEDIAHLGAAFVMLVGIVIGTWRSHRVDASPATRP